MQVAPKGLGIDESPPARKRVVQQAAALRWALVPVSKIGRLWQFEVL
jgi:hypothetical protein